MDEAAAAMLYATLKDHKQQEPIRLMMLNRTRLVRAAIVDEGFDVGHVALKEICKPINIILTKVIDSGVRSQVVDGLKALSLYNLEYKFLAPEEAVVGK